MNDPWRGDLRVLAGRTRQPRAALLDSHSVTTTARGGDRGFAGATLVTGRQRHLVVDTFGVLLAVGVTAASVQDRDGAKRLLGGLRPGCPRLRCLGAEGA